MGKILAVGAKEMRQILRDRRTLLILLFIPAFFLLLYGYALSFDIRNVHLAVQDRDVMAVLLESLALDERSRDALARLIASTKG